MQSGPSKYIGGKGLLLRYLWETRCRAESIRWAPDNPLIVMTGPFAGTGVATASRIYIGCKSPVTGILNGQLRGRLLRS